MDLRTLAEQVGGVHYSSVTQAVKRFAQRTARDATLRQRLATAPRRLDRIDPNPQPPLAQMSNVKI
jgi:hypothetical protein